MKILLHFVKNCANIPKVNILHRRKFNIKVLILHIGLLFEKAYKNIMKSYECYIFKKQLSSMELRGADYAPSSLSMLQTPGPVYSVSWPLCGQHTLQKSRSQLCQLGQFPVLFLCDASKSLHLVRTDFLCSQ